jgi:hypothetical protein
MKDEDYLPKKLDSCRTTKIMFKTTSNQNRVHTKAFIEDSTEADPHSSV